MVLAMSVDPSCLPLVHLTASKEMHVEVVMRYALPNVSNEAK